MSRINDDDDVTQRRIRLWVMKVPYVFQFSFSELDSVKNQNLLVNNYVYPPFGSLLPQAEQLIPFENELFSLCNPRKSISILSKTATYYDEGGPSGNLQLDLHHRLSSIGGRRSEV